MKSGGSILIDKHRLFTMPGAVLISLVVVIGIAVMTYAHLTESDQESQAQILVQSHELADHEARIRLLEQTSTRIDANLQQIKDWMREDRDRRNSTSNAPVSAILPRLPFGIGLPLVAGATADSMSSQLFGEPFFRKHADILVTR